MSSKSPVIRSPAPFEDTPLEAIPSISALMHTTFKSHKTKDIEWRLVQLRRLYWALDDYESVLVDALRRDLGRPEYESLFSDIDFTRSDCIFVIENLRNWARDEPIEGFPLLLRIFAHRVRKQPFGPALIIGTYNFPVLSTLQVLVGAIAAGCPAVIKPSESAPATAAALRLLVEDRLDSEAFAVVNGGPSQAEALLRCRWGKIAFTGGAEIGRSIACRAAETLTPYTLELGGLNPAIVTSNTNLVMAARRLMWPLTLNAGQVCMRQNYILVERSVLETLVKEMRRAYTVSYPNGVRQSDEYSRIVNAKHFSRIKDLLDRTTGKVVMGGEMDEAKLFMEPTLVVVDSTDDVLIKNESFGPLMAVMAYDTLDEAINIVNEVSVTPLALYAFGTSSETERILAETISGGVSINDAGLHGALTPTPFGGVGSSGTGAIRGRAGYEAFTHRRPIAYVPMWADQFIRLRYLPYDAGERKRTLMLLGPSVDFDREGRPVRGLSWWVGRALRLGGSGSGIIGRWLLVLLGVAILTGTPDVLALKQNMLQ